MRSILALTFDMIHSLKQNWKVYTMEAVCLGLFMVSASIFATLLEYPASPIHRTIPNGSIRNIFMGFAMGLSAVLIIYSPMGKLSGAHMNPALTFTFWRLGKIKTHDMLYYTVFQCVGGILAVYIMHLLLGKSFEDPHVNYVVTAPGKFGVTSAFITEIIIAFMMMTMVLISTNWSKTARYTGVFAGILVVVYVIISGPISGFGMNPARSLASAVPSGMYNAFWIYLTAPFIGMASAAALYRFFDGKVICAKFHHSHLYDCIFNCGYCNHQSNMNDEQKISTDINQYRPISTHSD
jgi:aquaporin Z